MSLVDVTECPRCTTATTHAVTTRGAVQICRCRICLADFRATVDAAGRFCGVNSLTIERDSKHMGDIHQTNSAYRQ